jgi:hypothetical protein
MSDPVDLEVGFSDEGEVLIRVAGETTVGLQWAEAIAVGQEITAMGTLVAQERKVQKWEIDKAVTVAATVASAGVLRILRRRMMDKVVETDEAIAAADELQHAVPAQVAFRPGPPVEHTLDSDCPCDPAVVPVLGQDMLVHRDMDVDPDVMEIRTVVEEDLEPKTSAVALAQEAFKNRQRHLELREVVDGEDVVTVEELDDTPEWTI